MKLGGSTSEQSQLMWFYSTTSWVGLQGGLVPESLRFVCFEAKVKNLSFGGDLRGRAAEPDPFRVDSDVSVILKLKVSCVIISSAGTQTSQV